MRLGESGPKVQAVFSLGSGLMPSGFPRSSQLSALSQALDPTDPTTQRPRNSSFLWCIFLESYKVIPKGNYFGAYGYAVAGHPEPYNHQSLLQAMLRLPAR